MSYVVKEIFYTLQGEGANVGRPARTKTALLERAIQDGLIDPTELRP